MALAFAAAISFSMCCIAGSELTKRVPLVTQPAGQDVGLIAAT